MLPNCYGQFLLPTIWLPSDAQLLPVSWTRRAVSSKGAGAGFTPKPVVGPCCAPPCNHAIMQLKGTKMAVALKTIGSSGQISLGKQHAGRTVTVEEIEDGVWLVKASRVIPENELWLHRPSVNEALNRAIEWAQKNPPKASDLDALGRKLARRR